MTNRLWGFLSIDLYTYSINGFIENFEVRQYGDVPLRLRGYLRSND